MLGAVVVVDDDEEEIVQRVAAIDVAKKSGMVCVRVPHHTEPGKRVWRTFEVAATVPSIQELADHLVCESIERVALESTGEYWRIFYYLLEDRGLDVWLVNARDVKNVPGRPKTDKLDAQWLAKLCERGMLRRSFVPPPAIRELRDLTRTRVDLVADRTRAKQRAEKVLEGALIKLSAVVSDIFGVAGRRILDALVAGEHDPHRLAALATGVRATQEELRAALTGRFGDNDGYLLALHLAQVDEIDEKLAGLSTRIDELTETIPLPDLPDLPDKDPPAAGEDTPTGDAENVTVDGVAGTVSTVTGEITQPARATARQSGDRPRPRTFADMARLVTKVPGMGKLSAQLVLAETGVDMSYFDTPGKIASWGKLTPRTIQSGASLRTGKTGRGNRYIRRALANAAVAAGKTDTFFGVRHRKLRTHRGGLKAVVATSRHTLETIWHMVSNQTEFVELGADYHTRRDTPERQQRTLIRRVKNLGLTPQEAAALLASV